MKNEPTTGKRGVVKAAVIHFNKAHYPVTVLGPGRRLGLWLQGCSIRCPGCVARDTWNAGPEHDFLLSDVLDACRNLCGMPPEGVTISGGEPFEQPEALLGLLDGLHLWRRETTKPFDILCYTGLARETVFLRFPEILAKLDVLIAGPFRTREAAPLRWRGSSNQTVDLLSDLARERWGNIDLDSPNPRSLQVVVDGKSIWGIGIPGQGDMEKLRRISAEKGLFFGGVSW